MLRTGADAPGNLSVVNREVADANSFDAPAGLGVIVGACTPPVEPSHDGTLSVSTVTVGDDPEREGFQLTIDGVNSVSLRPTDTTQVIIPAGPHALGRLGVADNAPSIPHRRWT